MGWNVKEGLKRVAFELGPKVDQQVPVTPSKSRTNLAGTPPSTQVTLVI